MSNKYKCTENIVIFTGREQGYKDMGIIGYQTALGLELERYDLVYYFVYTLLVEDQ